MLGIDKPTDGYIITGKYAEKMRYELRKAHDPNFVPDPKFENFPNNYDGPDSEDDEIIDLTGMSSDQVIKALREHGFNLSEDVVNVIKKRGFEGE